MSLSADGRRGLIGVLLTATGWVALALASARVATLTLIGLPHPGDPTTGPALERMQDFRDATYYPIREFWRSGGMPYDPQRMFEHWPVIQEFDLYLPAHLLIHSPLAVPDYRIGAALMLGLNGALVVLLARWAVVWARAGAGLPATAWAWAWPWLAAALLFGQVGKAQLYLGQINPLVALGTAGALGWRNRPVLAAVCLAISWLKPQFGLPLTLLLLVTGRRRTALLGTAVAAVASLPVVAVLVGRAGGFRPFLDVVRRNLAYATQTGYGAVDSPTGERIDLTAMAARAFAWSPPAAGELATAVVVLGLAAVVARLARKASTSDGSPDPLHEGLADLVVVLAVLVSVVHQPGDVLAAVPAAVVVAVLAATALRRAPVRGEGRRDTRATLALASAAVLAVPHLHLYAVDQAVIAGFGATVAGLLDALAVMCAVGLATAAAVLGARRPMPTQSGATG